ncbi:HGL031Cp [Eremothecium sinecaudum]|uniref:Iron-sulfur assembly protein 1 n=1 Tax=Eremothecium sinecaudum TaxID=45286 RepID=A0A0X8HVL9_9SACH|nr:HGL031Cp [Eremothecium sinecaudum]AMD22309.1 HGL031Cp [Eremothecium sinecaudum]
MNSSSLCYFHNIQRNITFRLKTAILCNRNRYVHFPSKPAVHNTIRTPINKEMISNAWTFNYTKNEGNKKRVIREDNPHDTKVTKWASYTLPIQPREQAGKSVVNVRNNASFKTPGSQNEPVKAAASTSSGISVGSSVGKKDKVRRKLRPRKALITLSPNALVHLKALLDQPNPKMIRIGVRNRGCSGLTYDLQYISEPGQFDEIVEQDGVKVVIDSKALFSIVGSEMDWVDDELYSRFVFKNPNSKGTCGCGESFMV